LIFRTSDVLKAGLDAWAYDFPAFDLDNWLEGSPEFFCSWKYFEIVLTSFLVLAGRGEIGGALLIVTGEGLDTSFLLLPLGA